MHVLMSRETRSSRCRRISSSNATSRLAGGEHPPVVERGVERVGPVGVGPAAEESGRGSGRHWGEWP